MRRTARPIAALALLALLAFVPTAAAAKRKIDVRPGPHAIADAVGRAEAGDVLRVHRGRYEETIAIDKPLRLVAASKRRPVIDGECSDRTTVEADRKSVV